MVDSKIEKILQRGKQLRASMVESIFKYDPLNTDIIYNKHLNTPQSSGTDMSKSKTLAVEDQCCSCGCSSSADERLVDAFIRGECMTKKEEQLALDTLQSLSAPELCHTTARSLRSQIELCRCTTCQMYNSYWKSDCKQRPKRNHNHDITICTLYRPQNNYLQFLEYIDSLKISISNFKLTDRGIQKVLTDCRDQGAFLNINFFLEYQVPEQIISGSIQNKRFSENHVRLCSKLCNNCVSFKHVSIHAIKNLATINLDQLNIGFKVCYRCPKQKSSFILGQSKLSFAAFIDSEALTCYKNLSVVLSDKTPIVLGTLKLSVQLGCDKLYFGQDFVDAIKSIRLDKSILSDHDASSRGSTTKVPPLELSRPAFKEVIPQTEWEPVRLESSATPNEDARLESQEKKCLIGNNQRYIRPVSRSGYRINHKYTRLARKDSLPVTLDDCQVLLGFIYIPAAQFSSQPINTYLVCQLFSEKEVSTSSTVVLNGSRPVYNFLQLVPILLNNELLYSFRENSMLIEFWKLEDSRRSLIGLAKISLHQFYLAYRNPLISEHLLKKELPVIGTDGLEPIHSPDKKEVIGQVEILTALGLEEQINKLKSNRGFSSVKHILPSFIYRRKRKPVTVSNEPGTKKETLRDQEKPMFSGRKDFGKDADSNRISQSFAIEERCNTSNFSSEPKDLKLGDTDDKVINKKSSVNIGTQSDMDQNKDNLPTTQDILGSFLDQLIQQKQKNIYVENSTNTEPLHVEVDSKVTVENARQSSNVELKRTSDLLDMLQNALSTDGEEKKEKQTFSGQARFRAKVTVLSANNLPSRKKCKPKKSKNRSSKGEHVLPSCYVTFETLIDSELYTTQVVSKSISPVWNYTRDVTFSTDLLTNGQKKLIFKVWRKSTNTVTCPNIQNDVVLGFAVVDLSVLLAGFPNIQGWFNIMDFSGKCNGQINIHITPLEDLSGYRSNLSAPIQIVTDNSVQPSDHQEPSEVFSKALKRKFLELDEITQRLRLRLSNVTNESDNSSDDMTEEFENDINTLCIEDDFDTINFEEEAKKIQNVIQAEKKLENSGVPLLMEDQDGSSHWMSCSENSLLGSVDLVSSVSLNKTEDLAMNNQSMPEDITEKEPLHSKHSLDKQLQEGKQHINSLLEKLTLLSSGSFTSKYVSGSTSGIHLDTEAILEKLDHSSRPNIQSSLEFDTLNFQKLYENSESSPHSAQTSNSSLVTNFPRRSIDAEDAGSSDSVSISTLPKNN